jgi:glycogen synthase
MHLIFVSYESPCAPAGGIAAVMRNLPGIISASGQDDVTVITPFHHRIPQTARLEPSLSKIAEVHVPYQAGNVTINILQGDNGYLFLRPDDDRFFAGAPHPYLVSETALRCDALLFGTATWLTIKTLFGISPGTLLLQDWHAATTALAACQAVRPPPMILTLHNSYDSSITDKELADFGIPGTACPGHTALSRALPFVAHRVPTVSNQFAIDLLNDPLQKHVMADHLGSMLKGRLTGVNNGPFTELQIPQKILENAAAENYDELISWKLNNRAAALAALQAFVPSLEHPLWGDTTRLVQNASRELPWFVMAGRDDTRQKGYDVAATAVNSFLVSDKKACFFFFPIPGDEGLAGLSYLEDLAHDFPEYVGVFPFRWTEGFTQTLRGATFGLMPSFYEPFGMANEFYFNGTPGIGRATGGIIQQIVPFRGCASFSTAAENMADRWHGWSSRPTGLLYRESLNPPDTVKGWKHINATACIPGNTGAQRLNQRLLSPLFNCMVNELTLALSDACSIYTNRRLYCRMITAGADHILNNFSWRRAASEYKRIPDF